MRAAFRDMRDDDDDELFDERIWNPWRILTQTIAGPLQGLPAVGDVIESAFNRATGQYSPDGSMLQMIPDAATAARKLATGKTIRTETPSGKIKENPEAVEDTLKAVSAILQALGTTNDTIAAASSLTNLAEDAAKAVDNFDGVEK